MHLDRLSLARLARDFADFLEQRDQEEAGSPEPPPPSKPAKKAAAPRKRREVVPPPSMPVSDIDVARARDLMRRRGLNVR